MKNNVSKLLMVPMVFVLFLSGCTSSRYTQGDRGDRRSCHHQGVNNRNYKGY